MSEANKKADRAVNMVDAFMDSSVGVDGKVVAAMRDKDKITLKVENPELESQVTQIASVVSDRLDTVESETQSLQETMRTIEVDRKKEKKKKKKRCIQS